MSKDILDEVISAVNSDRKSKALSRGSSLSELVGFIPTGITLLDKLLLGGVPYGRLTEVYGTHSVGKTTFIAQLIKEVQSAGGFAMVCDTESSMDRETVERTGAKFDDIAWQQSFILEDGFATIRSFLKEYVEKTAKLDPRPPCLVIWDTIAASPSRSEHDDNAGLADKARVLSLELRRITQLLSESQVALVFVNQVRDNIGGYGQQVMVPGGRAIKFHATLRLHIKKGRPFKVEGGQNVKFVVDKMKYGSPFTEVQLFLKHKVGLLDEESSLSWLLDNASGPKPSGSGFYMKGSWLKIDLPSKQLSIRAKEFTALLDTDDPGDELRQLLSEQINEFWPT